MRAEPTSKARMLAFAVFLTALLVPLLAWANEPAAAAAPASRQQALLRVVIGLAGATALAIALTHPIVRRIERRLGLTVIVSSGVPFLILGLIFRHPRVGILTDAVVNDLRPALEFAFGLMGFAVGLQFDVRELDTLPEKSGAVLFAETGIPMLTTTLACAAVLFALDPMWSISNYGSLHDVWAGLASRPALRDALALGACAAQSAAVAAVAIAGNSGSVAARIVSQIARLDDAGGVFVLAIICAFFRPTDAVAAWKLPHIAWLFVTLGMGGLFGLLTYVLLRGSRTPTERFTSLLGAVGLSAGMSGYLAISPIVSCTIAGALLVNLPFKHLNQLRQSINELERPLYMIFLLVAGALWDPTAWQGWLLVPVFVLARVGGKLVGAHVGKSVGPEYLPDPTTLGLALSPQSPITIVTIVSYATLYLPNDGASSTMPWLMTATIGGAVLTEVTIQAIVRLRGDLRFDNPAMISMPPAPNPSIAPEDHHA
jgi:hypothetical protein